MILRIRESMYYNKDTRIVIYKEYLTESGYHCRKVMYEKIFLTGFQNPDRIAKKEYDRVQTIKSIIKYKRHATMNMKSVDEELVNVSKLKFENLKMPVFNYSKVRNDT